MKFLKGFGMAVLAAVGLMAVAGAGTASAAELTCGAGTMCPGRTTIHATSEGHVIFHPPLGDIECASTFEFTTTTTGNLTEAVYGPISILTFTGCTNEAVVKVIQSGELIFQTRTASADGNGTVTSNGAEWTMELQGFHCIFKTTNTDIGTLTGSSTTKATATIDIEATISRTGGRSGVFCGTTAEWTGAYKIDVPDNLSVD